MRARFIHMAFLGLQIVAHALYGAPAFAAANEQARAIPAVPSSQLQTEPVPVPEPTATAVKYHKGNMALWGAGVILGIAVPTIILFSGFSARLRDFAQHLGHAWFWTISIYVCLFIVLLWAISLPLDFYQGFVREHSYGLSNQSFAKWAGDSIKSLLVSIAFGVALGWIPYLVLRVSPTRWWIVTSILAVPIFVFVTLIEPIWIAPLFNRFGPMKDKALEREILTLAQRAGIEGSRVFEVNKSVDTKKINAYVTGVFGTKRVVLWDTLIAKLDRDQVLFVMAHEMGHYVLGHIWKILTALCLLTPLTLYLLNRSARWIISMFKLQLGFQTLQDVASLPLFLLLLNLFSLLLVPFINAFSRHLEKQADTFALELTQNNHAAASAFVALGKDNLVHPRPGAIYKIWRASHPTLAERIEFCNNYAPWREGKPLRYGDRFSPGISPP
ncbi:MAG: M48 family metallopeptidase [Verrucomicrobia bacterium]|nr:M48 family metallopeptidase [Verrucomicrobiota bacterium]